MVKCPPIGSSTPSPTFFGSLIGWPVSLCTTQPSGIGSPDTRRWRIVPNDDTDVAMSSTIGASLPAGMPTASGLVPISASAPPQGAI